MKEFWYRHSRGVTRALIGVDLDLKQIVGDKALYLIDASVGVKAEGALELKGGEEVKDLSVLTRVYDFLASNGADRSTRLVAVGGGALLDLATFAAGTYMRGIGLVLVPTTLLAMIDAAIGGKGAVDWGPVKNLIGVFYQPDLIISDLKFLEGLPERTYRAAFAEAVKYGVVLDEDFFNWLRENSERLKKRDLEALEEAVYRSGKIKASVVELDEFELRGIRQVLNFGHTVGHAVERLLDIPHGEAVAVGMAVEGAMAVKMGYMKESQLNEVLGLLQQFGLPTSACLNADLMEKAERLVLHDKKRRGDVLFMPMPVGLGRWVLERVPVDAVRGALRQLRCSA
ncbi:MAG: 3-dehydroquinate synthase [Thermoproteus sp.]